MQGKLIAVVYTMLTYWNHFSDEVRKALNFDNFDNSLNSFLWPEYFIDYLRERWIPCQGFDNRLVFTLPPRDSTLQLQKMRTPLK